MCHLIDFWLVIRCCPIVAGTYLLMGKVRSSSKLTKKDKQALSDLKKGIPFDGAPNKGSLPRNFKAKQRQLIMSGLKHIGAPVET